MKKNILISVYNMEIGGIERSLINMLEAFDYDKFNVDLLIFHHTGEFMNLIPNSVNLLPQIDKYSVFRKSILQCFKEGHYSLAFIRLLSKLIAYTKSKFVNLEEGSGYIQMQFATKYSSYFIPSPYKSYDIAISYAWPHDIIANKVRANKKIAWIHTDYTKLEIDNKLDYIVWNKFDHIASISEEVTKSFIKIYPGLKEKVFLVENIMSPYLINMLARESIEFPESNEDTFKILSVGRLSYVKGFDLAIKALKELQRKGYKNIKWYIVGYGGYEKELKTLIKQFELEKNFILLGKKTNPYPYIKECDLYVQPSRYEGKAVTVTEAKVLGKPILITKYPTSKSQIRDEVDGIICELSVEGISQAIEMLVKKNHLRNKLITKNMEQNYANTQELEKLYSVISN